MYFYQMLDAWAKRAVTGEPPEKEMRAFVAYLKRHRPEFASWWRLQEPEGGRGDFEQGCYIGMIDILVLVNQYGVPEDLKDVVGH